MKGFEKEEGKGDGEYCLKGNGNNYPNNHQDLVINQSLETLRKDLADNLEI